MGALVFVLFAAAIAASSVHCEGLFDEGLEYTYAYNGLTSTGVKEPATFGSAFGIQGTLTVQRKGEYAVLKLDGVTFALGNGAEEVLRQVKYLKKAELTAVLEKPFRVKYSQGKIVSIETDPTDTFWSVSLKKGIASPLQMDVSAGAEFGKGENSYTKVQENTVAGPCQTTYSFGSTDALGKGFNLIKQRTSADCAKFPKIESSTFGAVTCDRSAKSDGVVSTTHQYYVIEKNSKGQYKSSFINTFGYTIFHLFQPNGVPLYNFANSTFALKKSGAITKPIEVVAAESQDLAFAFRAMAPGVQDDVDLTKSDAHIWHPEEPKEQKLLQTRAIEGIDKLTNALAASAVDKNVLNDQTLFEVFQVIMGLDLKTFKSIWEKVKGNKEQRKIFIDLLAQSGANAGGMFIKDAIVKGELDDQETRRVLAEFPFHIRAPTEKLLVEFEAFQKKSPFKDSKNERAFLFSLAHLAHKTCKSGKCKEETLNRIGKALFDKFKAAKQYEDQVTYVLALRNFGNAAALERLVPYTKAGLSRSLRLHTIYALLPLAHTKREKLMSVVVPIYLNVSEPTEIRVAAVAVILNSKPSFLDLQQIVAGIVWDRNPQVVNFVVTTFRSYSKAKNPCIAPFANKINILLRRISHLKTKINYSSNRYYDFDNADYGFGGGIQVATVYGDESRAPLLAVFRVGYRVGEFNYIPLEVTLHLEGVEDTFIRIFRQLDAKTFKLADLKDILAKLKVAPRTQQPFKVEVAIRYNQQVIFYRHLDAEKLKALFPEGLGANFPLAAKEVITLIRNQLSGILLGSYHFSWRPNDLGVPVGLGVSTPKHLITKDSFAKAEGKLPKFNIEMHSDLRLFSMNYMLAYNPLGISQGVIKYRASRVHIPLDAVIGINPAEQALTFALKTHTEQEALVLQMSAGTVVMVYGKDQKKAIDLMAQSCKNCKEIELVTAGKQFLRGEIIRDSENERLGLESHIEVYDCERYNGRSAFSRLLLQTLNPTNMNTGGTRLGYGLMALMHLRNFLNYYPAPGACNMRVVVHQAKNNPTTELELSVGKDLAVPKKFGVEYRYYKGSLKLKGAVSRQYDFKVQIEVAPANVKSKIGVFIERQPAPEVGVTRRATCFDLKTAYSAIPADFLEFPSAEEPSVAREVKFSWGETTKAGDCPDVKAPGTSSFTITGNRMLTDQQRNAAAKKERYPFKDCAADRKADGRTGATTPLTQACFDALIEYTTPQNLTVNAEYKQISNRGVRALVRAETLLRTALMPYWDMHVPHSVHTHDTTGPNAQNTGHVEMRAVFDDEEKDVELHLHTDKIHNHFSNVDTLYKYKTLLRTTRLPAYEFTLYTFGLIGFCGVAPKKTVTFDKVHVDHENLPKCWTLASGDCSPEPRYAVFVKKVEDKLPLAARFMVGGIPVELTPEGGALGVSINGKKVDVKGTETLKYPDADSPVILITRLPGRITVKAATQRVAVRYTGDDIDIFVPATYKSATCGLCGDFNGQPDRELQSPSGCVLASGQDVANAYVLKDGCAEKVAAPGSCIDKASGGGKDKASIADFVDLYTLRQ